MQNIADFDFLRGAFNTSSFDINQKTIKQVITFKIDNVQFIALNLLQFLHTKNIN